MANRNIKFRTWDTKKKQWLKEIPCAEYMLDSDEWHWRDAEDAYMTNPSCPLPDFEGRLVHQQYIGLNDKNGKAIFEGDIVSYQEPPFYHERDESSDREGYFWPNCLVQWDQNRLGFEIRANRHRVAAERFQSSELEVVGNIFDNPELYRP